MTSPYLVFYNAFVSIFGNLLSKPNRGKFIMSYLVCDKRKGSPKVHVEVCRRKCKLTDQCKNYKQFVIDVEKKAA